MVIKVEELSKIYKKTSKAYIILFSILLFYSLLLFLISNPSLVFNPKIFILAILIFILFLNLSIVGFLIFNFPQIIIVLLLEAIILGSFLYKFNSNFLLFSIAEFLILSAILILKLREAYKNSLKIRWTNYFKTIWNFYTLIILLIIFSYIVFALDLSILEKTRIENIVGYFGKVSSFFSKEDYFNQKISDIVSKNLDINLGEKEKKMAVRLYIDELNKKFSLNLKEDSTLKTAISEYLYNQAKLIKNDKKKEMTTKIVLGIFIFLTAQSILYFLGILISFFSYIIYFIFLGLRIIEIEKGTTEKDFIKI
jgi:hypothetical protein